MLLLVSFQTKKQKTYQGISWFLYRLNSWSSAFTFLLKFFLSDRQKQILTSPLGNKCRSGEGTKKSFVFELSGIKNTGSWFDVCGISVTKSFNPFELGISSLKGTTTFIRVKLFTRFYFTT